ncbi:cyclin-like protein [Pavlovales sp. CCMP2436]|nr:cyclin-like protein [Pavlovales sp. CCMP2436]
MSKHSDEAGQMLRNGKYKRTDDEQPAANDQKRAALGDISNKALQRCEQGISKLGVQSTAAGAQSRPAMRMTRLASRQMQQDAVVPSYSDGANPMSVENNTAEIIDVDAPDHANTQLCVSYVRDIYDHLSEIEQQHRIATQYMHSQRDINSTMRGILIDWLVEVAEEYRLVPETLYLAVNYIDRFLQWVPVNRGKLQLVGVTCMLIASKYEEVNPPAVDEFVYISDNTYTREEILRMEAGILNKLDFVLTVSTPKVFLKRFFRVASVTANANDTTNILSQYLCELTLQEYGFLKYLPSTVAASCLFLSLHSLGQGSWDKTMAHYTHYTAPDMKRCVQDLLAVWTKASANSLQAVQEKYGAVRFLSVSHINPPTTLPLME